MDIIISNASDKPIYEQIVMQMKDLILAGDLQEGQQLPSIRALASDLRISVITTKRAYAELESQGFIETVQGKGSFVAGGNTELLREERLRHIEELLGSAVREARGAGIELQELHDMLDVMAEDSGAPPHSLIPPDPLDGSGIRQTRASPRRCAFRKRPS